MDKISPEKLKRRAWHAFQAGPVESGPLKGLLAAEFLVPLVVVALLVLLKAYWMAGIVAAVALVILGVRATSKTGRKAIDRFLGGLAYWVGQIVATILLAPAFFGVMTLVRLMNRMTGTDPLMLRNPEAPTFWVPSDTESRRTRHARSMFCTERLSGSRLSLVPIAALGIILLVAAEVGLRIYGFGTPVLYVQDADVGYYPRANQRARAPGRIITINNHSMRAHPLPEQKTPGHVRILLLGDSTLAGTWVSNDELYSTLVEKKLNAVAGSPKFEVYNMGVNGWGPYHELAYVKKFGTFDADVAVICGPIYNAYRPHYSLERAPFVPERHPPHLAMEQIFYELTWRYRERWLGPPPWSVGERGEVQCSRGIETYTELSAFLQQHGAEVFFEMLPSGNETLGVTCDEPKARIVEAMTQKLAPLGVKMECAGDIFKSVKTPRNIYHDGVHFDRLGHQLYADYFADRLIKNCIRVQKAMPATVAASQR